LRKETFDDAKENPAPGTPAADAGFHVFDFTLTSHFCLSPVRLFGTIFPLL
jgi:hypothetical protein